MTLPKYLAELKSRTIPKRLLEGHFELCQQLSRQGAKGVGHPTLSPLQAMKHLLFANFWLKKSVELINADPEVFQREDAIVRFGVGKNMVRSIRHWCLATRVAEEERGTRLRRLRVTELENRLLSDNGWDPYLEDDATLWLIHWNLASAGTRAATWYWAFNQFQEYSFARSAMVESLIRYLQTMGQVDVANSTIKRDVDCFIHTYLSRNHEKDSIDDSVERPLNSLRVLVQESDSKRLRFRIGPKNSLPAAIFAYATAEFWNQTNNGRKTLEVREVIRSEGGPGLVFKLDQESVLDYLDRLEEVTCGETTFEDTALVRRIVRLTELPTNTISLLERYYGGN